MTVLTAPDRPDTTSLLAVRVSDRWRGRLATGAATFVTYVDWSNDGGASWETAPGFIAGSVNCDTTRQTRWAATGITISDVPLNENAVRTDQGINPFRTRFRVRHGLKYRPGDEELIGMGVYRCTSASTDTTKKHNVVLAGSSFESYLIKPMGAFPRGKQFRTSSANALLTALITWMLPHAAISWDPTIDQGARTPALQTDDDRWSMIDGQADSPSIARALGARVFCNGEGAWVVAPPGSLADPIAWYSEIGDATLSKLRPRGSYGSQFSATRELSNDGVYNVISVKNTSTDGTATLGPVVVMDNDPASSTYALLSPDLGGFGQSVRYYSSSMFTNLVQMQNAGRAMLAQTLGLKQSISFSRRYDPSIRPGTVGQVDTDAGPLRVILDSMDYDLASATSMSGTARTTSAAYSGEVAEWLDADAEGGAGEDG